MADSSQAPGCLKYYATDYKIVEKALAEWIATGEYPAELEKVPVLIDYGFR